MNSEWRKGKSRIAEKFGVGRVVLIGILQQNRYILSLISKYQPLVCKGSIGANYFSVQRNYLKMLLLIIFHSHRLVVGK